MPFQPSLMVQLQELNNMIHDEKDQNIKQDLVNQYNELVKKIYDLI
jgi:hypothetical protein